MDLNALRAKLAQLNQKTTKTYDTWKPRDEHQVRMVPNPHSDDPIVTLYFHFEVDGNNPVLCPQMNYGKDCIICEFAEKLKQWKDDNGVDKPEKERKADFEIFKKIQAKVKLYAPMVERTKEEGGAQWWGLTPAQAQQLLDVCVDGDRLSELGIDKDDTKNALKVLFDPDKAYDVNVSYAKPGEKGNTKTFTNITIKGRIKASPLTTDANLKKKILGSVKKIEEVFPEVSSADVKKIFEKYLLADAKEAKPEGGTEKYAKPNTKENAKLSGTRSIDDAFGDMLNNE